jgi:hypothetical protein
VSPGKASETLPKKHNTNKRSGGFAQVIEHLPSIHEALVQSPNHKNIIEMQNIIEDL